MTPKEFEDYFISFYHPKSGMYPMQGWTVEQLRLAIAIRGEHFEGDSFDREAIRDILMVANNQLAGAGVLS